MHTTGDALEQDVGQLRRDVNTLKASSNAARSQSDAIAQMERRNREQSADVNRQLTAMSSRLEALAAELNRVSTRLDDLTRRQEPAGRPSTGSRPSMSGGSATVPPAAPSTSARAMPPTTSPSVPVVPLVPPSPPSSPSPPSASAPGPRPTAPAPASRTAGGATAEESYQAAYLDFTRGRYELALSGFREFLRRYPDSPLADSAQYGIGESYYSIATGATTQGQTDKATRALEQAVQEFRKVVVIYPRGSKVPSALYKEALSLTELKQTALARARLQYLVDHFPQSEEAPLAKERLAALK